MSMKFTALSMDHGPKIRSFKLVLLALADRADERGICWPSRADLKARACMSDATLTRALNWLEGEGWLQRQRRFNSSNVFRLNIWRLQELEALAHAKRTADVPEGFTPFPEELAAKAKAADEIASQAIENKGSAHFEQAEKPDLKPFAAFPEEAAAKAKAPKGRASQAIENKGSAHFEQGSAHGKQGSAHFAAANQSKTNQKPSKEVLNDLSLEEFVKVAPKGWTFADFKAWQALATLNH